MISENREAVVGGLGSGVRGHRKRTTESCRSLDTAALRGWGLLAPGTRSGTLAWVTGPARRPVAEVGYDLVACGTGGWLRLQYAFPGDGSRDLDYRVVLVTTPCHFGGRRWWFVCPLAGAGGACRRRARKLFLVGRYFGCRHCGDLTYASTQQSSPRVYALSRAGWGRARPLART